MKIEMNLPNSNYDIILEKGSLARVKELLPHHNKILIIHDDQIPNQYVEEVATQFESIFVTSFPHGEANKSMQCYEKLIDTLFELEFDRKDAIIALGGGVTSDLAGFVASTYMRGISFYIIPTTLLSQADASIGGKVAINHHNIKNIIGAFYQPNKVIIDVNTLETLDERLFNEGMSEIIKMAMIYDKELFEKIENCTDIHANIEEIIYQALLIKKDVVEKDEKESNLRSILNFGHTVGHAVEALGNGKYYHGEAVSIGMLYFTANELRDRLKRLLERFNLPTKDSYSVKELMKYIKIDKKKNNGKVKICMVKELGKYYLTEVSFEELEAYLEDYKNEK